MELAADPGTGIIEIVGQPGPEESQRGGAEVGNSEVSLGAFPTQHWAALPDELDQGQDPTKALDDAMTQIFTGRQPVSSWDATMKTWRESGGDQIRGEFEEALAARGET